MEKPQEIYKTYRYKFEHKITENISSFANIHSYDDRETFKEAWKVWCNENICELERECARLQDLGYEGDAKKKMYIAARYYFRTKAKKSPQNIKTTRRKYIRTNKNIIGLMDNHIIENLNNEDYTPAIGYDNFRKIYKINIDVELDRVVSNSMSIEDVIKKMNKTYKNRYFINSRK